MDTSIESQSRQSILQTIISGQNNFNVELKMLIDKVVSSIQIRDTSFKRHFLSEAAVAVSFSLLQQIYQACLNFYSILIKAGSSSDDTVKYLFRIYVLWYLSQ